MRPQSISVTPPSVFTLRISSGISRSPAISDRPSMRTADGLRPDARSAADKPSDGMALSPVLTNGTT